MFFRRIFGFLVGSVIKNLWFLYFISQDLEILEDIKRKMYTIRGEQVMFDRDLARLYGVETRALN